MRWTGKGYDYNGKEEFTLEKGKGWIKEYNIYGELQYEGEYFLVSETEREKNT